jgi:hypothetical protein
MVCVHLLAQWQCHQQIYSIKLSGSVLTPALQLTCTKDRWHLEHLPWRKSHRTLPPAALLFEGSRYIFIIYAVFLVGIIIANKDLGTDEKNGPALMRASSYSRHRI